MGRLEPVMRAHGNPLALRRGILGVLFWPAAIASPPVQKQRKNIEKLKSFQSPRRLSRACFRDSLTRFARLTC